MEIQVMSKTLTGEIAEKYPNLWGVLYKNLHGQSFAESTCFTLDLKIKGIVRLCYCDVAHKGNYYSGTLNFSLLYRLLEDFFKNVYGLTFHVFSVYQPDFEDWRFEILDYVTNTVILENKKEINSRLAAEYEIILFACEYIDKKFFAGQDEKINTNVDFLTQNVRQIKNNINDIKNNVKKIPEIYNSIDEIKKNVFEIKNKYVTLIKQLQEDFKFNSNLAEDRLNDFIKENHVE